MTLTPSARYLDPEYCPGHMAPITGIYRVIHLEHRPDHDAVVICGEEFPPCRTCKAAVRYIVHIQASHITHDFDFAGPSLQIVKK